MLHGAVNLVVPSQTDVVVRVRSGIARDFYLRIDPRFHAEFARGTYESWVQELLVTLLRPGSVFCDVGAHIGLFVLGAARLVGSGGRVVAVEPDLQNYNRLLYSVEKNLLRQVQILNVAAWSDSSRLSFKASPSTSGRLEGTVSPKADDPGEVRDQIAHVEGATLDHILGPAVDVIKVDVEGSEVEVLRGATGILGERRAVWLIEAHSEESLCEVRSLLSTFGYVTRMVYAETATQSRPDRYFLVACP